MNTRIEETEINKRNGDDSEWTVLVRAKSGFPDHRGKRLEKEWSDDGLSGGKGIKTGNAYKLGGALTSEAVRVVSNKLLSDPVTEEAFFSIKYGNERDTKVVLVWPKSGVADPVGDTVLVASRDIGVVGLDSVVSGKAYWFSGRVVEEDIRKFCGDHLFNPLIQRVEIF